MGRAGDIIDRAGRRLGAWLEAAPPDPPLWVPPDQARLHRCLRPGDVLLVEGQNRLSTAIKYLTQSTWSHAALYVGDALPGPAEPGDERDTLVEVTLARGCASAPLSKYARRHVRICRPAGLDADGRARVVDFMIARIGLQYDMRNIVDLARYLFPTPPVPVRFRRRMLALGSGDPTRAICSSLIAQAFQSVNYPILPDVVPGGDGDTGLRHEVLRIRHHSLFTPCDFDNSPYFAIVKPTLEGGFDPARVFWAGPGAGPGAGPDAGPDSGPDAGPNERPRKRAGADRA